MDTTLSQEYATRQRDSVALAKNEQASANQGEREQGPRMRSPEELRALQQEARRIAEAREEMKRRLEAAKKQALEEEAQAVQQQEQLRGRLGQTASIVEIVRNENEALSKIYERGIALEERRLAKVEAQMNSPISQSQDVSRSPEEDIQETSQEKPAENKVDLSALMNKPAANDVRDIAA